MPVDLRAFLEVLETKRKLRLVSKPVDKDWEVATIARIVFQSIPEPERYGLMFSKVRGYETPIVTGIFGASREIYALGLGTTPDRICEAWARGLQNLLPPHVVPSGPVKEVIEAGDKVDLLKLPVPVATPGRDGGPFITAASVITKDRVTGVANVGTYRLQVHGKSLLGILILPHQHIGLHYAQYQACGEPMPVAIAVGTGPALGLASTAKLPYGVDEFAVAGGLQTEPVEVTKAEVVDLLVPADAEYVIEGYVPVDRREMEGPFGEWTGFMSVRSPRPVVEVACVTHRRDPIFQAYTSQMPPSESSMLRGQAASASLWKHFAHDLKDPGVRDVHFLEASGSHAHAVIQMRPLYPGHAKNIGLLASSMLGANVAKIVTIVDEDIDIRDPFMVEWASSLRVDPARDVTLIPRAHVPGLDPSTSELRAVDGPQPFEERPLGSKMIVDATIKSVYPEISVSPKEFFERALENWSETGLQEVSLPKALELLLSHHPAGDHYLPYGRRHNS